MRRISPGLMLALGYISMAGSLSTDLYLPAFPDIAADLGVGASTVQLTLTALLAGSALGQLLIGSVSDALGRRRTLLAALTVFVLCCYLAAVSPTVEVLILVRAVQGFAGASGTVLARAVIADLVDHAQAVRAFSTIFVMIALGPAVASPLGALLTQVGGWRAALLGLAALATGMLVVAALFVPESLPPERRHPFTLAALVRNIARLLHHPAFMGYTIAFGAGYAALMVYISSSSFIVQDVLDITPLGYSLTFSFSSVSVMAGAWLNGMVAHRIGAYPTLRVAQFLQATSAAAGVVLALTGTLTLTTYLIVVAVFAMGCGSVMSSASALAVGEARATAGAGSALVGFTQFVFGAVASPLGGIAGTQTALPAMTAMAGFATVGLVSAWLAWSRRRR
ncbi:multidrug effflux MFS transporter [Agromyces sp. ZXT2-6]|uniref:multidrug effflux MFS transporter n=1 Tax=Agromyces sp. ZXT2-6 TaxID=3461153 RepID=UPI0040551E44